MFIGERKKQNNVMIKSSFEYDADRTRKQRSILRSSSFRKPILLASAIVGIVTLWMTSSSFSQNTLPFELVISAFGNGDAIPMKYARDGGNISPEMTWTGIPAQTASYALIVDDPDAPTPEPWVHWIVFNLPLSLTSLPEGQIIHSLPPPAQVGLNSWSLAKYDGPQPPSGQNHLYIFTLYALDQKISFASRQVTKNDLTQAMTGHILAETNWTGRFGS